MVQGLERMPGSSTVVSISRWPRSGRRNRSVSCSISERGVKFHSITEHIDTETPAGRAMWQMIGVFAEFERCYLGERTGAGIIAAVNPGCMLQLETGVRLHGLQQRVMHVVELLDLAYKRADGRN